MRLTQFRLDLEKKKEQCTFKPKINEVTDLLKERIQKSVPVGEYLHSVQKTFSSKIEKKKEEEDKKAKELANQKFIVERSAKLLSKAEKEKLLEIFRALDSDNDGSISAAKVDITRNFSLLKSNRTFAKIA